MSTVDPAVERRRQALERLQRPPRPQFGLWVLALICWSLWTLFAYSLADTVRYPIAEAYLPPSLYPDNVAPPWFFGVFVGSFGGFIAGFLLSYPLKDLFGLAADAWGQFASTLLAWAVGFWRGRLLRTAAAGGLVRRFPGHARSRLGSHRLARLERAIPAAGRADARGGGLRGPGLARPSPSHRAHPACWPKAGAATR